MEPLVEINIAVYNHAPYLRAALDGVLNQKTTFPFRLLIGDDCSTDGSIEILKEYEKKYPDKVKVIYQPKNLGLKSPDRNGIILLKKSTAKYIALLDGDDFWISPNKLQEQISFLEANNDVVMSAHNSNMLFPDGEIVALNRDNRYTKGPHEKVYSAEDYITRAFFQTSSMVFRREALGELPDWFATAFGGDFFIVLLTVTKGNIHYINDIMSVYRINPNSTSNYHSRFEIYKNFETHLEKFDEYSGYKYHKWIQDRLFLFKFEIYYYYPSYPKKLWYVLSNLGRIIGMNSSVISRWTRYKIFLPTFLLKSKVNLYAKKQKS